MCRKRLDPSGRRNNNGLDASSGGVSRSDACSAASVTIPVIASRSSAVANLMPMSWRLASECKFQRRHVDRFSPTSATTE